MLILALIVGCCGASVTAMNFYLSFVRCPLHRRINKGRQYKFSSGVPLIGSILLWVGAYLLLWVGALWLGFFALILSAFDTGGIHWFIVSLGYQWLIEIGRAHV